MKHSRPNIANSTQELLKFMYGANQVAFLEMHRVIKNALNTLSIGFKVEPKEVRKSLRKLFNSAEVIMMETQLHVPCSTVKGERLLINTISPFTVRKGGKKYWLLIAEDSTDYVWSYFLKN